MTPFYVGLALVSAATLMLQVVLTRLLSVVSWYYLAFVAISLAMFGLTAGALLVELRPAWFDGKVKERLYQATLAMAFSIPASLLLMLAIPLEVARAATTVFTFIIFSAVIAVPFVFAGLVICLSLTKSDRPIGRVYAIDLGGAALGSCGAVLLLTWLDGPSGIIAIGAMTFAAAAAYAKDAGLTRSRRRSLVLAVVTFALAIVNSLSLYGVQPIWSKGRIDRRTGIKHEMWNPISKVRATHPWKTSPSFWGPSPITPPFEATTVQLNIDNDAGTEIAKFDGDLSTVDYLKWDVTSLAAQMRPGGSAAIIGVGGGRDVLTAAVMGFRRIVGIEVNPAMLELITKRMGDFAGMHHVKGLELNDAEGRSFLRHTDETFDVVQASLVDTWAATAAGAMTLTENTLYTVEAWETFYRRLAPGGLVTFSRWRAGGDPQQTYRIVSLAWAVLLRAGVTDPAAHLVLAASGPVATLLLSNQPFSAQDLSRLQTIVDDKQFEILLAPGKPPLIAELQNVMATRSTDDLAALRYNGPVDYSPVYDESPFFFNSVRLAKVPELIKYMREATGNLRALGFMMLFALATLVLVVLTIIVPARRLRREGQSSPGGVAYFVGIGLGFMFCEIAMTQQLTLLLGHPVYAVVVVLTGIILATGVGSLASERVRDIERLRARMPALLTALVIGLYAVASLPVIHAFEGSSFVARVVIALALVTPFGVAAGFCFPIGLRWMRAAGHGAHLPWMWALNGAASVLAASVAVIIAMEASITATVMVAAVCYVAAAAGLPWRSAQAVGGRAEDAAA